MDLILPFNEAWLWLILTGVFILIEATTTALVTIWFALGAAIMIFLSFLPIPFVYQVLIFLVISIVLLLLTRPILTKKLQAKKVNTNVDSLIGQTAVVIKNITAHEKGEIKTNGLVWSAKSIDNSEIEQNTECTIIKIEGVTAIVEKK